MAFITIREQLKGAKKALVTSPYFVIASLLYRPSHEFQVLVDSKFHKILVIQLYAKFSLNCVKCNQSIAKSISKKRFIKI